MSKKIKYEKIKNYIEGTEGNGCKIVTTNKEFEEEIISQNKNNTTVKIKIICGICKKEYETNYENFKRKNKRQCNECGKKISIENKKISYEHVQEFIKNNNCELLTEKEDYIDTRHNINIKCSCGESFIATFDNFHYKNKRQCNKCGRKLIIKKREMREDYSKKTKTTEIFKQEVLDKVGNEYTVLGKYINNHTKILIKHNCNDCNNYEFSKSPSNFLRGEICPICSEKKRATDRTKTNEEFIKEVYKLVGDEYTVLGEYTKSDIKIKFRHNNIKCNNNEFEMKPANFLQGNRCPECNRLQQIIRLEILRPLCLAKSWESTRLSQSFVFNKFKEAGYYVLECQTYKNSSTKIKYICPKHKDIIQEMSYDNFRNGCRCRYCNQSKGERNIREYLTHKEICFENQYSYENLRGVNNGLLRFDFVIFKNKEKSEIEFLLEYDGSQHFYASDFFGGEENLNITQFHDELKNKYCFENNILLHRIHYKNFKNLENILDDMFIS